jgi:hypothetical protein
VREGGGGEGEAAEQREELLFHFAVLAFWVCGLGESDRAVVPEPPPRRGDFSFGG